VSQNATANANAVTASLIALGDSIFHGKAGGGACFVCHGADAKGSPGLAPNLTDSKWLNGDGSYGFLLHTVEKGIPDPKESSAPMPPMGGAKLTPEQVRAVAAYIYSLSHPEVRGPR
jgi:mono/diheme cytochrome c family protein